MPGVAAVSVHCLRCGSPLGRLCRDGLGAALRDARHCPHRDELPLEQQQAVWRAWEEWARTDDLAEVHRVEGRLDLATERIS